MMHAIAGMAPVMACRYVAMESDDIAVRQWGKTNRP